MLAIVEKLKKFFAGRKDVKFAVVYYNGVNRFTDDCDVDVAIYCDRQCPIEQLEELSEELSSLCGIDIGVIDFNCAGNTLVEEILSEGEILVNNADIYSKLTKLMWYDQSQYEDDSKNFSKTKHHRYDYE